MRKQIIQIFLIILLIALVCAVFIYINLSKKNMEQNNKIKLSNNILPSNLISEINLTSEAFENNQAIPKQYSYKGKNINPPLLISNVPKGTKSLALIVDDPDAPVRIYVHWLVWNIPAETFKIEEGTLPQGSIQGLNDFQKNEYDGPYPPSGTHRYFFKLYALDFILNLDKNSKKSDLENIMKGHILAETSLVGLYSK